MRLVAPCKHNPYFVPSKGLSITMIDGKKRETGKQKTNYYSGLNPLRISKQMLIQRSKSLFKSNNAREYTYLKLYPLSDIPSSFWSCKNFAGIQNKLYLEQFYYI